MRYGVRDHVMHEAAFAAENPRRDVQLADDVGERFDRGLGQRLGAAGLVGVQDGEAIIDKRQLRQRSQAEVVQDQQIEASEGRPQACDAAVLMGDRHIFRKIVCPLSWGGSSYTASSRVARSGRADPHRRRTSRGA